MMTPRTLCLCIFTLAVFTPAGFAQPRVSEQGEADGMSELQKHALKEISRVLKANYKAMEEKKSELSLSHYHPRTNLQTTRAQLDQYFARVDMSYVISNIRYIGHDGVNHVIVYHEVSEFRRAGERELFDKQDTDVMMVFRQDEGAFKIYTSRSLAPGPGTS